MKEIDYQRLNLDLEYLISEMELKLHEAKQKNINNNYFDAENKIQMLKNIQFNFYELFYEKNELEKSECILKFQNKLLTLQNIK
jgi:hypothetical protein